MTEWSGSVDQVDELPDVCRDTCATVVTGDVALVGEAFRSTADLWCVTEIGGDLEIQVAPGLQTLDGLDHLTHVGGRLTLNGLDGLQSVAGLGALTSIGGDAILMYLPLASLDGLEALTTSAAPCTCRASRRRAGSTSGAARVSRRWRASISSPRSISSSCPTWTRSCRSTASGRSPRWGRWR